MVVAHGHGADPKPAGAAVARTDHSGFDVVVDADGDGVVPGFDDARTIVRVKGLEPGFALEIVGGEAEVVEQALIGVGQAAIGRSHPDGLRVEVGEDAVACFAGDEGVFVAFAIGDVDGEAAEASWDAIHFDGLAADFDPDDFAVGGAERKVDDDHLPGLNRLSNEVADDGDVFGQNDLGEGMESWNFRRVDDRRPGRSHRRR